MAKIVELIWSETHRGDGKVNNPHRKVQQLWTKNGHIVAEYDAHTGESHFEGLGRPFQLQVNKEDWE